MPNDYRITVESPCECRGETTYSPAWAAWNAKVDARTKELQAAGWPWHEAGPKATEELEGEIPAEPEELVCAECEGSGKLVKTRFPLERAIETSHVVELLVAAVNRLEAQAAELRAQVAGLNSRVGPYPVCSGCGASHVGGIHLCAGRGGSSP